MDVVLWSARVSFFSTTTSVTDSGLSSEGFSFSLSLSTISTTFSTLGDLDLSAFFGDFSGVFDFDFDLRRVVASPSSSELDDEDDDDEELDDDPGGAIK
jgi:hypothetical protein